MDRFSHVVLARALLEVAGERQDMAYMSTLPMIDQEPSFLHRLQCHPLVKGPVVADAARMVFGSTGSDNGDLPEDTFELVRMREDVDDFREIFNIEVARTGIESMAVDDGMGALLSVVSHTYFDTYNNPVQAFTPFEGYCSGQYEMWKKLDYFAFRRAWYEHTAADFRQRVVDEPLWDVSFPAEQLIAGLVDRLAALSKPGVSYETVAAVKDELGIADVAVDSEVEDFYLALEEATERHLVETVGSYLTVSASPVAVS